MSANIIFLSLYPLMTA